MNNRLRNDFRPPFQRFFEGQLDYVTIIFQGSEDRSVISANTKSTSGHATTARRTRGPGHWQRMILDRVETSLLVGLRGTNRTESAAIRRAARLLAEQMKIVIIHLWSDDHSAVQSFAAKPGAKARDGRPIEEKSVTTNVAPVPTGARRTFAGSIRDHARREKVSPTTIWRDMQEAKGQTKRCPHCNRKM